MDLCVAQRVEEFFGSVLTDYIGGVETAPGSVHMRLCAAWAIAEQLLDHHDREAVRDWFTRSNAMLPEFEEPAYMLAQDEIPSVIVAAAAFR